MTTTTAATATRLETSIPPAGTWQIDNSHSEIGFTVRHMMVSKVRGRFTRFDGEITIGDQPLASTVTATIDATSVDTDNEKRDEHVRSADFFDVATYPTAEYRSTRVVRDGDGYIVEGELTLHGVTRPVTLRLETNGVQRDPWGGTRTGFTASGEISRKDFGMELAMPMDGGGVVVGDRVQLNLEIEAVLQAAAVQLAA